MDATEFKQLFLPCSRKMFSVAWRLTGNDLAAEDLVQDTFLRLWTKRDELEHVVSHEAYCITTLKHVFYDQQRKAHLGEVDSPPDELQVAAADDVGQQVEQRDVAAAVFRLIAQLPEPQRTIIQMRDVDDMAYEDIAAATGFSQVNVRVQLSRARKRIREQLGKWRMNND